MSQTKQQLNRTDQSFSLKKVNSRYVILAGAALLIGGITMVAPMLGSWLAPSHLSAANSAAQTLDLSHLGRADADFTPPSITFEDAARKPQNGSVVRPDKTVVTEQTNPDFPGRQEFSGKTVKAEARKAAIATLTEKLARLQLSRSLHTAKATFGTQASIDGDRLVQVVETKQSSVSKPQTPEVAAVVLDEYIAIETEAELATEIEIETAVATPLMPETVQSAALAGIPHPAPRLKPAAPRAPAPALADKNEAKPAAAAPVLAYAAPGNPEAETSNVFSGIGKLFSGTKGGLPGRSRGIAVYDISAATVHMPDGTKLEAHSGIGHRKDNPKYSHVKNLGPTPPNIYDLRMREKRFYGVEAIRMTPRDVAAMKGRDGMLTHSPLLRRGNGSHGCVAFKDYDKFLKAFKAGKVKKMIVVPSMNELPTYMASL